jgi:hypothetical protein
MVPMHRPLACAIGLLFFAGAAEAQSQHGSAPIEMGALSQLDAWTVGAIGRAQGALPDSLWSNSNASQLSALFDRMPATFDSPAALLLARRALASAGTAPSGDGAAAAARKRFAALGRLGLADDVSVMAAPALASDPEIAQYAAQADLARGRTAEACQRGRLAVTERPAAFLLRLRAFCAATAGEQAAVDLALEVARSANAEDPWLRSALQTMAARPARPPAARFDTSLNAAVSIAARLAPGPSPLRNSSSLALLVAARTEGAPVPVRTQAAALAFRRGLMTTDAAREAIRRPETETNPPPLAAAIRQAEAAPRSLQAASAIAQVLRRAALYVDFAAASRLFHDDIAALESAPDAQSAALFARAAAASGDTALARRLADSAAQAGVSAAVLAPVYAAIAVGEPDAANASAAARRLAASTAATAPQASRDLAILAALDFPLGADARAHMLAYPPRGGGVPDAAQAAALGSAVQTHAIGETALAASLVIARGAHTLEANALVEVIRALRAAGLDSAARNVAVEALLGGAPR